MNKIFKVIWSETKHAYCVVSEIAHTHGRVSTRRTKAALVAVLILTSSALGQGVQADGRHAYSAGEEAQAQGNWATAVGAGAQAQDTYSTALGNDAKAIGGTSTAVGAGAQAQGDWDTALGSAKAIGGSSVAVGFQAQAVKVFSMALGRETQAQGQSSTALGYGAIARLDGSVALGSGSIASIDKGVVGYDPFIGKASTENSAIWKATQAALSVGSTVDGNNLITRQITGVAAGSEDTDAVNVAQLKALNAKVDKGAVHYFSVNSSKPANPAGTNWDNDGATGADAVAIGNGAKAKGFYSTALGYQAQAQGNSSTALGHEANAVGNFSTALGYQAQAQGHYSMALGYRSIAEGRWSTALGLDAIAQGAYSMALGWNAKSTVDGSVALGEGTVAGRDAGKVGYIALGGSATFEEALKTLNKKEDYANWIATINASKEDYVKFTQSYFNASKSGKTAAKTALETWKGQHQDFVHALEEKSKLEATWRATKAAVSVGADGVDEAGNGIIATRQITNVAAGTQDTDAVNVAQLKALNTKVDKGAIHYFSVNSTDQGKDSNWKNDGATGDGAIAIGPGATAKGDYSTALGKGAIANGESSTALGQNALAQENDSIALGFLAQAQGRYSMALGGDARALRDGSVALGEGSVAWIDKGVNGYDPFTGKASKEKSAIWKSTRAAVSVGSTGEISGDLITRQITNVAAGTKDTDAVNVAQLKALNTKVDKGAVHYFSVNSKDTSKGSNWDNDGATGADAVAIGPGAQAKGDYSTALGNGAQAQENSSMALGYGAIARVEGSVALGIGSIASIDKGVFGYDPFTGKASTETSAIWKATHAAFSVGSTEDEHKLITRQITGVAAGSEATDAVNVAQLKALDNKVTDKLKDAGGVHYFSVKSGKPANTAGTNWDNDGATGQDAVAIGNGAIARVDGGVALGIGSIASIDKGVNGYDPFTGKASIENSAIWKATHAAFSVGSTVDKNHLITRQITGVAAGTQDTDAVNVAQLRNVATTPLNFYFGGTKDKTTNVYTPGTANWSMPLNEFRMDFGDGLKAEQVTDKDGNKYTRVTLDKDSLKNDSAFKGDKGADGANGKSAYEIWKEKSGNEKKTQDEFINEMKGKDGAKGADGANGKSAYEIWKEKSGNETKTQDDFINDMKGKDGANVEAGDDTIIVDKKDPAKAVLSLNKNLKSDSVKVGTISLDKDKGIDAGGKKITGIAAGEISQDSKDAVNGSQLFAMNRMAVNNMNQINNLRDESREGDAMGAAIAALKPLDFDPYQRSQVMAGVGYYRGKEAVALGLAHYKNEDLMIHGGLAYAGNSNVMANVGVSYRFGSSEDKEAQKARNLRLPQYDKGPISSVYILQDEVQSLKRENDAIRKENKEANDRIAALEAKLEKVLEKVK